MLAGELFLGQSSGALEKLEPPPLLDDIDRFFITGGMAGAFPWMVRLLYLLPIPALQHFLGARERIIQVRDRHCLSALQTNRAIVWAGCFP